MKVMKPFLFLLPLVLLGCSSGGDTQAPPMPAPKTQTSVAGPLPAAAFSCALSLPASIPAMQPGEVVNVQVSIKNTSSVTWPCNALAKTAQPLCAAYHICSASGAPILWDGNRTPITTEVASGSEITLVLKVKAPNTPGKYVLQPDLVQENVAWFSRRAQGGKFLNADIQVQAARRK